MFRRDGVATVVEPVGEVVSMRSRWRYEVVEVMFCKKRCQAFDCENRVEGWTQ